MKYLKIQILFVTCFLISSFAYGKGNENKPFPHQKCEEFDGNGKCRIYGVSLIELIARPEALDGKKIRVEGYFNLSFEGNALYLHREDFEYGLRKNGLWVEITHGLNKEKFSCHSKQYVLIEGTFNSKNAGHMGLWSGSIENISRCQSVEKTSN